MINTKEKENSQETKKDENEFVIKSMFFPGKKNEKKKKFIFG